MARRTLLALISVLCCAALAPAFASAAEPGAIAGTVTEAGTNEAIEDTKVCAIQQGGESALVCTLTDAAGDYLVEGLPPGEYEVEFAGCIGEDCSPAYATRLYDQVFPNGDPPTLVTVTEGGTAEHIDASLEPNGALGGTIESSLGGPIANAFICVDSTTQFYNDCSFTDSDGEYIIENLPPGEFNVEFTGLVCDGGAGACSREDCEEGGACSRPYIPQYFLHHPVFDPEHLDTLIVDPGETVSGVNATLVPGGKIEGTVSLAALGNPPLAGITVCASPEEGELRGECVETDPSGHYVIEGLATAPYLVEFKSGSCDEGGNCTEPYGDQFFNDKTSAEEADLVHLTAPATASGIDASLVETAPEPPKFLTNPTLSGTPVLGATLGCSEGSWSHNPTSIAFAWLRDGAPIAGQAGATYVVVGADEGASLACEATVANPAGSAKATSNALAVAKRATSVHRGGGGPKPGPAMAPKKGNAVATAIAIKAGKLKLTLECPGKAACKGSLKLELKKAVIGTAPFSIAAGKSKKIAVKLTRKGKSRFAKIGKQGLRLKLTGSGVKAKTLVVKPAG